MKWLFLRKSVRIEWHFRPRHDPEGDHFHFSQQIFILSREGLARAPPNGAIPAGSYGYPDLTRRRLFRHVRLVTSNQAGKSGAWSNRIVWHKHIAPFYSAGLGGMVIGVANPFGGCPHFGLNDRIGNFVRGFDFDNELFGVRLDNKVGLLAEECRKRAVECAETARRSRDQREYSR